MTSAFAYGGDVLHCEGVAAETLAREFGTPLYVYSRATLVERYDEVDRAFAPLDRLIAYSVKANGNLSLLRLLAERGAGADIVSGGELQRARLAGIPAERIVFSGVGKTEAELAAGVAAGLYGFNVESEGELRRLSEVAARAGARAPVALRVNPDVEPDTPHHYTRTGHATTKFGVPFTDARRLYELATALAGIEVRGIDMHIGSQIADPAPYAAALQRILVLVEELRSCGIGLEYIDIGGGFGISYDGGPGPVVGDFADRLLDDLRAAGLTVVVEPGRYVAGPAGVLLARVLEVKQTGRKTFVITDAGMNDLLRPSHYASYHSVRPATRHAGRPTVTVDVVGPVCETGDFLALDRALEAVEAGDLLVIGEAGAYGFSMSSTYNARPRPAEALVSGNAYRLVRRRESLDDLVRGEIELLEEDAHGP